MRLIDADALIEHLKEYKTIYGTPMTNRDEQVVHCVIGHIKNLEPTAYDPEAVVAELEKYAKSKICDKHKHGCPYKDNEDIYCENCGALGAISIVRGKE